MLRKLSTCARPPGRDQQHTEGGPPPTTLMQHCEQQNWGSARSQGCPLATHVGGGALQTPSVQEKPEVQQVESLVQDAPSATQGALQTPSVQEKLEVQQVDPPAQDAAPNGQMSKPKTRDGHVENSYVPPSATHGALQIPSTHEKPEVQQVDPPVQAAVTNHQKPRLQANRSGSLW